MSNVTIFCFFIILSCAYIAWRSYEATCSRGEMADLLDEYLASNAPQAMKEQAYAYFHVSTKPLFLLKVVMNVLFVRSSKKVKVRSKMKKLKEMGCPDSREKLHFLLMFSLYVQFKRAPITSLIYAIILILVNIIQSIKNRSPEMLRTDSMDEMFDNVAH
jgi:hypothetical protein